MFTVSTKTFMGFVSMRQRGQKLPASAAREKVLRPDQLIDSGQKQLRRLATCPACDAVVAADILDTRSGLCPRCHAEAQHHR